MLCVSYIFETLDQEARVFGVVWCEREDREVETVERQEEALAEDLIVKYAASQQRVKEVR